MTCKNMQTRENGNKSEKADEARTPRGWRFMESGVDGTRFDNDTFPAGENSELTDKAIIIMTGVFGAGVRNTNYRMENFFGGKI